MISHEFVYTLEIASTCTRNWWGYLHSGPSCPISQQATPTPGTPYTAPIKE